MSSNCLPTLPKPSRSIKVPRVASSSIKRRTRRGRRAHSLRVAPGKIIKAQAMLVDGCSQREISRALEMSPHTVAKLIKTEDFQNFIRSEREELFGIASLALDSFRAGVTTDPRLAYVFLKDLAIVPSRDAMLDLAHVEPPKPSIEDRQTEQIRMIAAVIQERYRVFNIELPADMKAALEREKADSEKMAEPQTQPDPCSNNDTDTVEPG